MIQLDPHADGTTLTIKTQPGARQNKVVGVYNGMLKVSVTAAPEKGKANAAVASVFGAAIGVSRSCIELISGATSTQKRFLVRGIKPQELRRILNQIAGEAES